MKDFGYRELCACVAMAVMLNNLTSGVAEASFDEEKLAEASFAIGDAMRAKSEGVPGGGPGSLDFPY